MRPIPLLALAVIFATFVPTEGRAWDLAIVGGFNYSHPSVNPDPPNGGTISTRAAFDIGVLTSTSIGESYQFEAGVLRHTRTSILADPTASVESQYSGWLIPVTIRFMRAEFFGFGFGPYFAALSTRTKTHTVYAAGGTVDVNATDPGRRDLDVGLRASLRIAVPVYRSAKVILDGSYLFGFTDLNKSGINEDKTQELLLLLGLQIPLGGGAPAASTDTTPDPGPTPVAAPAPSGEYAPASTTPLASPTAPTPKSKPSKKVKRK